MLFTNGNGIMGGWKLPTLLLASWAALAGATTHDKDFKPDYVLVATEEDIKIDCQTRRSVVINGTLPGPPLHLKENQTSWIRVYNQIPKQNLTLHWHGLAQRAAPFSDGTPLVSQWPIPPNRFFDYEVRPEIGDAGTYFYHSHIGFQQLTAHGALIVDDACEVPYHYDEDMTLMFGDFFKASDESIVEGLLADPFTWSGEPDAIMVNGHSGTHAPKGSNATDPSCTPLIIDVEPSTKYRVRVIGRSVLSLIKMGIEDHDDLTVIEADGQYTKRASIDHVQAAPGQRFSVLLKTMSKHELKKAGKSQFWVRLESRDRPEEITGYALLRYKTDDSNDDDLPTSLPKKSPVKLPENTNKYLEYALEPLSREVRKGFPTLDEVTRTVTIQVNQKLVSGELVNGTLDGPVQWVQNDHPWLETVQADNDHDPYLIAFYNNEAYAPNHTRALKHGGFDPVSRTFTAKPGEVLDIVWESNSGPTGGFDFHPMHVHGEHVYDLGSGNGTYNAKENEKHFQRNGTGKYVPARRDTSILYRYTEKGEAHHTAGWRAWRIRVTEDNVGVWMMHCHIAQHIIMGMNTVWAFGERDDIISDLGDPPYIKGYLDYGGSAYGDGDLEDMPHVEVDEHFGKHGKHGKGHGGVCAKIDTDLE